MDVVSAKNSLPENCTDTTQKSEPLKRNEVMIFGLLPEKSGGFFYVFLSVVCIKDKFYFIKKYRAFGNL